MCVYEYIGEERKFIGLEFLLFLPDENGRKRYFRLLRSEMGMRDWNRNRNVIEAKGS